MTQIATQGNLRFHPADALWPVDFFSLEDLPGFLDRIYVVESQVRTSSGQLDLRLQFAFAGGWRWRPAGTTNRRRVMTPKRRRVPWVRAP